MTFHQRRIAATRKVRKFRKNDLLKQGAATINLWSTMPEITTGTVADDWKAVGSDMRRALATYADECG